MGAPNRNRTAVLLAALVLLVSVAGWLLNPMGEDPAGPPPDPMATDGATRAEDRSGREERPPAPDVEYRGADRVEVTGLVLSILDGRPIAGARVRVKSTLGVWASATDATGAWGLGLPPTVHYLTASARGFLESTRQRFLTPSADRSARVPTVYLHPARARARGRVVDAGGDPVAGAKVLLHRPSRFRIEVRTNGAGRFGPVPVDLGTVYVEASAPGRLPAYARGFALPGRTLELEIRLPRHLVGRGIVIDETGRPVPGARVYDQMERGSVTTDADGRFTWPLDDYLATDLTARKTGYDFAEFHEMFAGREVRIVLPRAVRVEGRIRDHTGKAATGLWVQFSHPRGERRVTSTDDEGRFALDPTRAGTVHLRVSHGMILRGNFEVEARWPGPMTGVELTLPEPEVLPGIVVDAATDAPLQGVEVRSWRTGGPPPLDVSDTSGRFEVPVLAGESAVFVLARPGYISGRHSHTAGRGQLPMRVALRPAGRVRLRAVDRKGRPLAGTLVRWRVGGWVHDTEPRVFADLDGVATASLPHGVQVDLILYHPSVRTAGKVRVTPRGGETIDLGDVTMGRDRDDVTLVVLDETGRPLADAVLIVGGHPAITADAAGRIRAPWFWEDARIHAPEHETVEVRRLASGAETTYRVRRAASFRGRVVDPAGRGVSGAQIITDEDESTETDGDGRFEISGVAAGTARILKASAPNLGYDFEHAWAVAGGAETVFRFPGTATLKLVRPDGKTGVAHLDATVTLLARENLEAGGPLATDPFYIVDGDTVLMRVPASEIVLGWHPWSEDGPLVLEQLSLEPGETRTLSLPEGDPPRITVLPVPPRATEGEVEVDVSIVGTGHDFEAHTEVVHVRIPAVRLRVAGGGATVFTDLLDVRTGGSFTVHLPEPASVRGVVTGPTGKPVDGADVRVRAPFGFRHRDWVRTDAAGRFALDEELPVGHLRLEVRREDRLPVFHDIEIGAGRTTDVDVRLPGK